MIFSVTLDFILAISNLAFTDMQEAFSILEVERLAEQSAKAAGLMRALSNEQRLLILCHLAASGELSVSALGERVRLSQSALSQHLAKLRDEGIVSFRREAQTLFYHIADEKAEQLLGLLHKLYCPQL